MVSISVCYTVVVNDLVFRTDWKIEIRLAVEQHEYFFVRR